MLYFKIGYNKAFRVKGNFSKNFWRAALRLVDFSLVFNVEVFMKRFVQEDFHLRRYKNS